MDTWQDWVLPSFSVLVVLTVLVIIYLAQNKTSPTWIHQTAFVFRKIFKALIYFGILMFVLFAVLPYVIQEGAVWLAPGSTFGYAIKYEVPKDKVYVESEPHDCEWGKAPLGNKYCHFEKVVATDKDEHGKVTAVYVSWNKVSD